MPIAFATERPKKEFPNDVTMTSSASLTSMNRSRDSLRKRERSQRDLPNNRTVAHTDSSHDEDTGGGGEVGEGEGEQGTVARSTAGRHESRLAAGKLPFTFAGGQSVFPRASQRLDPRVPTFP